MDLKTGLYHFQRFELTDLLTHDRDHLLTYRVQSKQHGWHLNSAGLPQCAAETALLTFLQGSSQCFCSGASSPNLDSPLDEREGNGERLSHTGLGLGPGPGAVTSAGLS